MRLIYFGSGEFGVPTFEHLVGAGHEVVAVVSQPDRPAGRHRVLTPTPVAQWAAGRGLAVFKSENVNTAEFVGQVQQLRPEAAVVIAFGQKLSPELIGAMGTLAVNLHASLLPRHRGAAPINWAMIAGDYETGVSVIGLAQRMDAGAVYATARTTIEAAETAGELHDRLAKLGGPAVAKVIDDLQRGGPGALSPIEQDETTATKAPKLSKADGYVDFDQDCFRVRCRIHGLTPWPGVRVTWHRRSDDTKHELLLRRVSEVPDLSCFLPVGGRRASGSGPASGTVMEGLKVACADGAVRLLELQLPGGKAMDAEAFARGHGLAAGDVMEKTEIAADERR